MTSCTQKTLLGLFLILPSMGWMPLDPSYTTKPKFFFNDGKELTSIKQDDLLRFHHLKVEFPLQSKKIILDLHQRRYILDNIKPIFPLNNKEVTKYLTCDIQQGIEPIHYTGKIRDIDDSLVNLTFCGGITGQIKYNNEILFIVNAPFHKNGNFINLNNELLVYRRADSTLNSLNFLSTSEPVHDVKNSFLHRRKRDGSDKSNKLSLSAFNEKKNSVFIKVGLVVDNALYNFYDKDQSKIEKVCKNVINEVSEIFQKKFNADVLVFVALVHMEIWQNGNKIDVTENSTITSNNFVQYAKELIQKYSLDHVQLITNVIFKEDVVARFSAHELCKQNSTWCGVIHYDESFTLNFKEHFFLSLIHGMICGTPTSGCENNELVLQRLNNSEYEKKRTLAIKKMEPFLIEIRKPLGNFNCLKNKPSELYRGPVCGNRFIEQGEDCDCGLEGNGICDSMLMCDARRCCKTDKTPLCISQGCDGKGDPKNSCNINTWNTIQEKNWTQKYMFNNGRPINSTRIPRFLKLALVIDRSIYQTRGNSSTAVNEHYKKMVNKVNSYFQKFDIFIALVNVEIWSCKNITSIGNNWTATFENFGKYVKNMTHKNIDHVQLITGMKSENKGIVHVSENSIFCSNLAYGVIGDTSIDPIVTAIRLTQALALSMGIKWDNDINCTCIAKICIMTNLSCISENNNNFGWSSCSEDTMKKKLAEQNLLCLEEKPKRLFDSPNCGNGFTEEGEECDCGWKDDCNNPCCNSSTCKYTTDSSCATGECCNTNSCTFKDPATVCRSTLHNCDLPEYCDGSGEYCPDDVYKNPGTDCDSEGPKCDNSRKCKGRATDCKQSSCHGHGICNSEGNCHCDDEFDPHTDCKNIGSGGSINSGPARKRNKIQSSGVNLIVLLLVIIVSVILILITIYFTIRKCSKLYKPNQSPPIAVCINNQTSTKPMSPASRPLPPRPNTQPSSTHPSIVHSTENYYYESIAPEYAMIPARRFSELTSNRDSFATVNSFEEMQDLRLNSIYSSCGPRHSFVPVDPSNIVNNLPDGDERNKNGNYVSPSDGKHSDSTTSSGYLRPIPARSGIQPKIGNPFPIMQVPENPAPGDTSPYHNKAFTPTVPLLNTQTEFSDENAPSGQDNDNDTEVTSQIRIGDSSLLSFFSKFLGFSKN